MKKQIITTIGCIVMASAIVGCAHTSSTASAGARQQVAISIARNGTLTVAGKQCSVDQLTARLSGMAAQNAVINADIHTPYSHVVAIVDACKAAGVEQFSLRTIQ